MTGGAIAGVWQKPGGAEPGEARKLGTFALQTPVGFRGSERTSLGRLRFLKLVAMLVEAMLHERCGNEDLRA